MCGLQTLLAKGFPWRIMAQGLFTGARALQIGVDNGDYTLCPGVLETIFSLDAL